MFILQLFSNGMKESEQRHVTLRINAAGININMHMHIHKHIYTHITLYIYIYIIFFFFFQLSRYKCRVSFAYCRGSRSYGTSKFYV